MVEPQPDSFSRASTPRAPILSSHLRAFETQASLSSESPSEPENHSQTDTEGDKYPPEFMPGDARNRSTTANRRRPGTMGGASRQSTGPPPPGYLPSDSPQLHHPSFHYPSPPFAHQPGYFGQYTVPSQPPALQGPLFSYPLHAPDGTQAQSQHPFPQQLHPAPSPYHFPHRHTDDTPTRSPPFSRTPSQHRIPLNHSMSSPDGHGGGGHTYMGSPPGFQPMGYSPQHPSSPYGFAHHYSAPPGVYQPFGAMHFPLHASTPSDTENQTPQGSWYFVPHNQQPQFDNVPFRPGYQYQYQRLGQHQDPSAHVSPSQATTPLHQQRPFEIQNPSSSPPLSVGLPPSNAELAPSTTAGSPPLSPRSKPITRREWHPRPPAHRSPWVMWVGNVPSDATQEELWKFFTQIAGPSGTTEDSGVESIHLISRSNCAFINYSSDAAVNSAIASVNGLRLRPNDPQCPMLVCKIRRSMDDLQSGVGGQRGIGLHKQWIRDQRNSSALQDGVIDGKDTPDHLVSAMGSVSLSPSERSRRGTHTSSSSSHASTTSSFLVEFFPTRYFILKSLSEDDLDLSVQNGLWATQKHNELLLDQAFRTARDVYLIFSVNKSGEFYGYAKMIGPIRQGEGSVNWVMRGQGHGSPGDSMFRAKSACGIVESPRPPMYFTPNEGHLVDVSPQVIDAVSTPSIPPMPHFKSNHRSAPPKFGGPPPTEASYPPSLKLSLDRYERARAKTERFRLDPEAPSRAMRNSPLDDDSEAPGEEKQGPMDEFQQEVEDRPGDAQWGECFKVEWLERRKIPFHRTRHLRNPWNKSREIKISRDGTELEPAVGAKLLKEWGNLAEADPIRLDGDHNPAASRSQSSK